MDRGAWRATVRRVAKSQTQLKLQATEPSIFIIFHPAQNLFPNWFLSLKPLQFTMQPVIDPSEMQIWSYRSY